jgi:predicted regulator of Ras-like GTPase activity (Roadblock/LC7/MglB family)
VFKGILKDALEGLPGALGAVFADWEGEAVEYYFSGPDDDIKLLGAHQGILFNLLRDAARGCGQGAVTGMVYTLEGSKVVSIPIKDGYYLVILMSGRGNCAMGLRAARKAARVLIEEI